MTEIPSAKARHSAPLDPELAQIVAKIAKAGPRPSLFNEPAEARANHRRAVLAARQADRLPTVRSIENMTASDCDLKVPVRVYRPLSPAPHPTVVFFHGGGFVLRDVELFDEIACKFCRDLDAVVVSAEYRVAPEHRFPAAHDDALAATRWVIGNVAALGGDRARIGVMGESAGANLAASTAIALRDHEPPLAAQLLVVPSVDMARDMAAVPRPSPDFPMLTADDLLSTARLYLGPRQDDAASCPPSPLRAGNLRGVAPAVVAVAGHDPLSAEGRSYARKLADAGVRVELLHFETMFHPFLGFFAASAGALQANDAICAAFSRFVGSHPFSPDHSPKETDL